MAFPWNHLTDLHWCHDNILQRLMPVKSPRTHTLWLYYILLEAIPVVPIVMWGVLYFISFFNCWSPKTVVCICLLNCKLSCENGFYGVVLLWSHLELELSTNMINIFLCGGTHCWRAIEITWNWNCLFTRSDSFITLVRSCEM